MAYGLRLRIEYNDINDVLTQVNIYQDGYSGSADVRYANAGLKIQWGDESNPDPLIYGSSCTLFFDAEFDYEFLYLFSSDAKKHKVEVKKGGSVFWVGFIEPDSLSEPMHATPYPVQCTAYDGLGFLRDVEYVIHDGLRTSIADIFAAIIAETGLSLTVNWSVGFKEAGAYEYYEHLIDDTIYAGLSCYEVLEQLFQNCLIYQRTGSWYIWDWALLNDWGWTIADLQFEGTPKLDVIAGLKKIKVVYDLGYRKNLVLNGSFDAFNPYTSTFDGWYNILTSPIQQELNSNGEKFVFIPGTDALGVGYGMSKLMPVTATTSRMNVSLSYALIGMAGKSAYMYISIGVVAASSVFSLQRKEQVTGEAEFEWVETAGAESPILKMPLSSRQVKNGQILVEGEMVNAYDPTIELVTTSQLYKIEDNFEKFKASVNGIPATGTLKIILHLPLAIGPAIEGAAYAGVAVDLFDEAGEEYPTEKTSTVTGDIKNNYVPDDINLLNGDYQLDIDNHKLIYKGGFTRPDGVETTGWNLGGVTFYSYAEFIGRLAAARMVNPRQIMRARLMDVIPPMIVIFEDLNNPGIIFIETGITYDDRYQSIEGSFTEIKPLDIDDPDADEDTSFIVPPQSQTPKLPDPVNRVDRIKMIDRNGVQVSKPSQLYENDFEVREPVSGEADDGKGRIQIKREGIAPYNLRRDTSTVQFSLSSAVTGNVGGNPAIAAISAGKLISHNWNAQDKDNQLKSAETSYNPEREWDITGASIEFSTTATQWLYIKAPVDDLETDAELVASEDHIDPLFEDGFVYYKIGYASAVSAGQREIRTLWGGGGTAAADNSIKVAIDFVDAGELEFVYNCPVALKFTSQESEGADATISPALNTDMAQYGKVTITAAEVGLIVLNGVVL